MQKIPLLIALCCLGMVGLVQTSQAVQVNQAGLGEVLIFPYYTVNNDLNTLYTVVNTTDQPKAIKVRFLEGEIGRDVLIFNVYLAPYDIWTGALVPTTASIAGHIGENSVLHLTTDQSCAPFLNKSGQEFLPFLLDLDSGNDDLARSRQGYMEVMEMGVLTGEAAEAVSHSDIGFVDDCSLLEEDWTDNNEWDFDALNEPTGGLAGSASLVNVAEGLAMSYDAIALQNFWQGGAIHTDPGSQSPDLSNAFPESQVLLASGQWAESEWSDGAEAVSAVLMSRSIMNEYAHDELIDGKTEWVLTFPTKRYHTNRGTSVIPPFINLWSGRDSCEDISTKFYDREGQSEIITTGGGIRPPSSPPFQTCYASNVIEFISPASNAHFTSEILGVQNHLTFKSPANQVTENGWGSVTFADLSQRMDPVSGVGYFGLPVIGFAVQQFTNAGAAEGLLAQYGNLFIHKYEVATHE